METYCASRKKNTANKILDKIDQYFYQIVLFRARKKKFDKDQEPSRLKLH